MDLLSSYTHAVRRNHGRVAAVDPGQLDDPTPCTDWDVRTLIGHLTGGYQMFAAGLGQRPAAERLIAFLGRTP